MKTTLFAVFLTFALASAEHRPFIICVPDGATGACERMVEQGKGIGVQMSCLPARDRLDCVTKTKEHLADFTAVDPEDMYIAGKLSDQDFSVFKEIRTKEEPNAEFRYGAVAVVHKDLEINNLQGLKGLTSCHTGVGRNVGYKIPITKLTKMGILGPLSDSSSSARENELKALSNFFSKACLVGKWSPHPETNIRLKKQYSNLCELCENPSSCDYPDSHAGYEGALKCLARGGGQVAWTKVIFVRKFFGMPYGSQGANASEDNHLDYAYLCPDATKRGLDDVPCTWANRPWPGYMANADHTTEEFKQLRDEIAKLNELGESTHAEWIASVLALNNRTLAKDNEKPVHPMNYLEKAKYVDVIERDVLAPRRVVRICVTQDEEVAKCELFSKAVYARDIRPSVACVTRSDKTACMAAVQQGDAEVVIADPYEAYKNQQTYKLKPLVAEKYGSDSNQKMLVIVKKSSDIQKLKDLKGKTACVQPYGKAGYDGAVKILLDAGLMTRHSCSKEKTLSDVYQSEVTYNRTEDPLACLESGYGQVAFLLLSSLHKIKDDIEAVCGEGRVSIASVGECNLAAIPPQLLLTSQSLTEVQQDDILFSLLGAGDLFSQRPDIFRMFGDFNGKPNVMFSNYATGLQAVTDSIYSYDGYKQFLKDLNKCTE